MNNNEESMRINQLKQLLSLDRMRIRNYDGPHKVSELVTISYRIGQYLLSKKSAIAWLPCKLWGGCYRIVGLVTGIQLPLTDEIDGGLLFPHFGYVVFAGNVKIGKNATIHQGVTIGRIHFGRKKGVPVIGDNVVIYAGANVCGSIRIGNNVVIGANSVVLQDVPDNCVVVGAPARVISHNSSSLLEEGGRKMYWCEA